MKRLYGLLGLACVLAACAAPVQSPTAPPAPTSPPAASPATAEPAASVEPLGSSVLLAKWRSDDQEVWPFDVESGLPLAGFEPFDGAPVARSSDGRRLALVETHGQTCEAYSGGAACRPTAVALRVVDVGDWREAARVELPPKGWVGPVVFSPDGSRIAATHQTVSAGTLLLVDATTGHVAQEAPIGFEASVLTFGPEGQTLAAYGVARSEDPSVAQPDPPQLEVFDAATLETEWQTAFPDIVSGDWCLEDCDMAHGLRVTAYWTPAVVVSRDGRRLHIVHADSDRLTTVDLEAYTASSLEITAAVSWVEQFLALTAGTALAKGPMDGALKWAALSADGTRLYVSGQTWDTVFDDDGQWELDEESLGLKEIDVESGRILAEWQGEAGDLSLTPDGEYVVVNSWNATGAWLLETNGLSGEKWLAGWRVASTRRLDGQPILLASGPDYSQSKSQMGWIDPVSLDVVNSWSVGGYAYWLASP